MERLAQRIRKQDDPEPSGTDRLQRAMAEDPEKIKELQLIHAEFVGVEL